MDSNLPDLDPADARPLNQQIAAALRTSIESGGLAPGARVPGENTLMARYGVSRWTAREALATLANAGLITKVPKVGTFVHSQLRLERRSRRVDPEAPRARYQQVADRLRESIERGDYPPGEALPSQPELARRYGLDQTGIGRAISVLRNAGLVRVEKDGAFVQEIPTARRVRRIPYVPGRGSTFAAEMRQLRLDPKTDLVHSAVVEAPPDIAERLGIEADLRVLMRQRHMYASGRPVQLATSYIPLEIAGGPETADPDTNPATLYERLAARGHRAAHVTEEIEVRRPTDDEAEFLAIPDGHPVLEVARLTHDQHGRAIDVAINILSGYHWRLVYEWDEGKEVTGG